MKDYTLTIDQLRERIKSGEISDPLVFLEAVMQGIDPRVDSKLARTLLAMQGTPSDDDWYYLRQMARDEQFGTVSITESLTAGKTLTEYLHPKRKQVDVSQNADGVGGAIQDLTKNEIRDFLEVFIEEY